MKLQVRRTSIHKKLAQTMAQNVLSGCSTIAYVKIKILANMYATREAPKRVTQQTLVRQQKVGLQGLTRERTCGKKYG